MLCQLVLTSTRVRQNKLKHVPTPMLAAAGAGRFNIAAQAPDISGPSLAPCRRAAIQCRQAPLSPSILPWTFFGSSAPGKADSEARGCVRHKTRVKYPKSRVRLGKLQRKQNVVGRERRTRHDHHARRGRRGRAERRPRGPRPHSFSAHRTAASVPHKGLGLATAAPDPLPRTQLPRGLSQAAAR